MAASERREAGGGGGRRQTVDGRRQTALSGQAEMAARRAVVAATLGARACGRRAKGGEVGRRRLDTTAAGLDAIRGGGG